MNINAKNYWDYRFETGDWGTKGGFNQSMSFATSQIKLFDIDDKFHGSV